MRAKRRQSRLALAMEAWKSLARRRVAAEQRQRAPDYPAARQDLEAIGGGATTG